MRTNYICKKCLNDSFYPKKKLMVNGEFHVGLYCDRCHKWHKWTSKFELYKKELEKSESNSKIS